MTETAAIRAEHVTKAFAMRRAGSRTVKASVLGLLRPASRPRPLLALDDVCFSVARGETLGIIGANGAGKSTLLSLIAGTMRPSRGSIAVNGKISSLLELGAGFHPDLTGRENVFLYGAIMGLTRRQMQSRLDSIVAFAGLEDFIEQPVKHYSSGMYVRLGFAVAVETNPDMLLVDEVLAVGDADFQRKCLARMDDFRRDGKTMLIISHDLKTIQAVSDRILHLDHGRIHGIGDPAHVVREYETLTRTRTLRGMRREWGTGDVTITGATLENERGETAEEFAWGRPLYAVIRYKASRRIEQPVFGFAISTESGHLVFGSNTQIAGTEIPAVEGEGAVRLEIGELRVASGTYLFSFSVHSSDHRTNYHRRDNFYAFRVRAESRFEGCHMPSRWSLVP